MNSNESKYFDAFKSKQKELNQSNIIDITYRGDSFSELYKRFDVIDDKTEENRKELFKRLFLIGDKSKYFYCDSLLKFVEPERNIGIEDFDKATLVQTFHFLQESSKIDKQYIIDFFKKNKDLYEYFSKPINCTSFVNDILSSKHHLALRNYYLKILHQLYVKNYKNTSHFISTTKNKSVAYNFSKENGIIIHSWSPKMSTRIPFKKINLPRMKISPFKDQAEESILAGILPHFISAIEIVSENKLYINPSLFKNKISKKMFLEGLEIDQSEFIEYIKKTNFRKSFSKAGKIMIESENFTN